MKTKCTIAGREIELESGREYAAVKSDAPYTSSRLHNVKIFDLANVLTIDNHPVVVIPLLSSDDADAIVDAFNNGVLTIKGRFWE